MGKKFNKTERVTDESNKTNDIITSPASETITTPQESMVDLQKIIDQSKSELQTNPVKRKRATKAEMAARNGQTVSAPSQPIINYQALPEQDFTMATEPLLRGLDILASNFVAAQEKIEPKKLKADPDDLKEVAKSLNKPLTILSAHFGASANPVNGAYFAIGMTLGGLFLGKYFAAQDLKNQSE